ncbi:tyrosine recombinase XerC [Bordetella avium]|uniref:tyrosine recombinase XerC n=1 Tax=Bordetella avium TaxID=521 RepID=UPI000E69D7F8|nr:tyrosine recombinase XerC [Bordetella avium]AZY47827.1 tyrosine recombinase XerC [Bordetella avium]AZY51198.1 tyrosine recombinase XerC [Bordetella avium]RIQ18562.1 tyrosine recombinase XerC [Bordetella avium]RIQ35401.1 tyrosine recombinase XerC [Bordetella avium]
MSLLAPPLEDWLQHLQTQRRYSSHTLAAYRHDLESLAALATQAGLALQDLSVSHIRQQIARLHAQGLGPRSLARRLAAWRGFYQWWAPHIGLARNPVAGVRAPKAPRALPKALSVDQAQAMLDHAPAQLSTDPVGLRDHAISELLYSSGLRLSELVSLDTHYHRHTGSEEPAGWLNRAEAEVVVLGKGGKRRIVPVGSAALAALDKWLQARPTLLSAATPAADSYALFLGARGARISPRVVQLQLARLAQQAGVPAHVHPHVLRHSFASHVLQSAQDLRAVQELLGHANIATTQVYTRLDFQHLAKVYDQAHPRANRKPEDNSDQ